jgi:spore coat protein U-like protein
MRCASRPRRPSPLAAALLALGLVAVMSSGVRAATCSFVSAFGPAFGNYDVFSATSTDSVGNISYTCSGGATLTIALSAGGAPSFNPRRLARAGGGFTLSYNLFLDAGHTQIWGDGTGGSLLSGPTSPVDNAVVVVPIFGSLPPGQDVGVGAYSDTIMVTLNF